MALSRKDTLANYLFFNPHTTITVLTEISDCEDYNSCSGLLSKLIKEGKVVRERKNNVSFYSSAPGYTPVIDNDSLPAKYTQAEIKKVEEEVIRLQERGFWRRASTLLAELSMMQNTAQGVGVVAVWRNSCARSARAKA
ncbi:hypothetical protein CHU32_03805 [Superficieibacter electus]|uniref:PerC family transcriptional regulator n=1 Tax=Superficieibacter electus TaxID=2022662 RepID=A0A2P5GVI4_9ENTR|nr:hypothetical protein [Superficieibacter electus]POP42368.1 hypothetical protein CHU33_20090 [Superficieibacter electus]POP50557.1 hypothetical protein CHU32_03805 [Superficieibacter electus]